MDLTRNRDYEDQLAQLRLALNDCAWAWSHTGKYANKLYPEEALAIIALSRSPYWPLPCPVDGPLTQYLLEWITDLPDRQAYLQELIAALHETNQITGATLRLNLACLTPGDYSQIVIVSTRPIRRPVASTLNKAMSAQARTKGIAFLREYAEYHGNLEEVYARLRLLDYTSDTEGILLGWLGYLALRSLLERPDPGQDRLLLGGPLKDC